MSSGPEGRADRAYNEIRGLFERLDSDLRKRVDKLEIEAENYLTEADRLKIRDEADQRRMGELQNLAAMMTQRQDDRQATLREQLMTELRAVVKETIHNELPEIVEKIVNEKNELHRRQIAMQARFWFSTAMGVVGILSLVGTVFGWWRLEDVSRVRSAIGQ